MNGPTIKYQVTGTGVVTQRDDPQPEPTTAATGETTDGQ
jgi:hypothetical protein